jgi:hypothetical protein
MGTTEDPAKETHGLRQWSDHLPMEIPENNHIGLQNSPEHVRTCTWIRYFLMIDRERTLLPESVIQVFESALGF